MAYRKRGSWSSDEIEDHILLDVSVEKEHLYLFDMPPVQEVNDIGDEIDVFGLAQVGRYSNVLV